MSQEEEILSVTLDPSGFSAGAQSVVDAMGKMADAGEQAAASLGLLGKDGAEALTAVATEGATAGQALSDFGSAVSSILGSVVDLVKSVGELAFTFGSLAATFLGELVSGAADYGMSLQRINLLTDMSIDAAAGFVVGLGEVGLSAHQAGASLQFFARQLEGMADVAASGGGGGGGSNAARTAMEETARAAQQMVDQIGDAQQRLADETADAMEKVAQIHQDTADKLAQIVADEKTKLEDLAQAHVDAVGKIARAQADLNADFAQKESDRASDYSTNLADLARVHEEHLATIAEQAATAAASAADAAINAEMRKAEQIEQINQKLADTLEDIQRSAAERAAHAARTKNEQTEDENRSFSLKMGDLEHKLRESKPQQHHAIQDEIEKLQRAHGDALYKINRTYNDRIADSNQAAADATVKAARAASEAVAKASEQATKTVIKHAVDRTAAENKNYDNAVAKAKESYDKQERNAKESHDRQLKMLAERLADEDKKYAEKIAKEEASAAKAEAREKASEARKLATVQESLEKQQRSYDEHLARIERAHEEHLARIAQQEANAASSGGGGGGAKKESPFEIELRKLLAAAGEAGPVIDALFVKIKEGDATLGTIGLENIAEGFKNLQKEADNGGKAFNAAGVAAKLFGRNGALMLPFLLQGKVGFEEAEAKARKFGLTIGEDGVQHSREFVKAQADMGFAIMGLKEKIGLQLMPTFVAFFELITGFISKHSKAITDWVDNARGSLKEWAHDEAWPMILGWFDKLKQWWADHKQEIFDALIAVKNRLVAIGDWVLDHKEEIYAGIKKITDVLVKMGEWIIDHKEVLAAMFIGLAAAMLIVIAVSFGPLLLTLAGLSIAIAAFALEWGRIWDGIGTAVTRVIDGARQTINDFIGFYNNTLGRLPGAHIDLIGDGSGGVSGRNFPSASELAAANAALWPNGYGIIGSGAPGSGNVAGPASPFQSNPGDFGEGRGPIQHGAFAHGLWDVPGTGSADNFPAWLAPGELVMPADMAANFRANAMTQHGGGGGGGIVINFTGAIQITAGDLMAAQQTADDFADRLGRAIRARGAA